MGFKKLFLSEFKTIKISKEKSNCRIFKDKKFDFWYQIELLTNFVVLNQSWFYLESSPTQYSQISSNK